MEKVEETAKLVRIILTDSQGIASTAFLLTEVVKRQKKLITAKELAIALQLLGAWGEIGVLKHVWVKPDGEEVEREAVYQIKS